MTPVPAHARPSDAWRPTCAHLRVVACVVAATVLGPVLRRPDLVVLAAPLAVVAVWSVLRRPAGGVRAQQRLDRTVLREGERTRWRLHVEADDPARVAMVATALEVPPWCETEGGGPGVAFAPSSAPSGVAGGDGTVVEGVLVLRSTRWGRRVLPEPTVVASSAWGAFRAACPAPRPLVLVTLPVPVLFDARAPGVHAPGLVGMERAPVQGSGTEFAEIRPFRPGDKLRQVDWARSSRSTTLQVASTWADHDRLVVLVVDAVSTVGPSEGVDGGASSLDLAVRAAAAVADHHLRRGDRVALHVIGGGSRPSLPPRSGTLHLRRVLDRLASIEPGASRHDRDWGAARLPDGALLVVLSPLLTSLALDRTVAAARRGLAVVVVDTFPTRLTTHAGPASRALAWRIRLLGRDRAVQQARRIGVPVVPWRGPGSLDDVLRDLQRRSRAPRLVRR